MKEWKDINYLPDYQVSNSGQVRSIKNGKIRYLDGCLHKTNGCTYIRFHFYKGGKKVRKFLHRLVAETFIPNPNNYKVVRHINGNTLDNSVENLEWVIPKYN